MLDDLSLGRPERVRGLTLLRLDLTDPGTPAEGPSSQAFNTLFDSSAPKNVERNTFDSQNFDAVTLCYLAAVAAAGFVHQRRQHGGRRARSRRVRDTRCGRSRSDGRESG